MTRISLIIYELWRCNMLASKYPEINETAAASAVCYIKGKGKWWLQAEVFNCKHGGFARKPVMFSSCCKRIDGQQRTLFRPISCWYVSFSNLRVNEMKEGGKYCPLHLNSLKLTYIWIIHHRDQLVNAFSANNVRLFSQSLETRTLCKRREVLEW